jgi:hypothetical protein
MRLDQFVKFTLENKLFFATIFKCCGAALFLCGSGSAILLLSAHLAGLDGVVVSM